MSRERDDLPRVRFHDRLGAIAQHVLDDAGVDDDESWCAVIAVSGAACDAAAGWALASLLDIDDDRVKPALNAGQTRRVRELLRSKKVVNLKPKAQRAIWETLSGDRLARWPDWIRYLRCVDRRNSVVHQGVLRSRRRPGRADAVESLEVMYSLHAHLAAIVLGNDRRTPLA